MDRRDELLDQLGQALADLAGLDAGSLVSEARDRAHRRVAELLEEGMVDALLERSREHLVPGEQPARARRATSGPRHEPAAAERPPTPDPAEPATAPEPRTEPRLAASAPPAPEPTVEPETPPPAASASLPLTDPQDLVEPADELDGLWVYAVIDDRAAENLPEGLPGVEAAATTHLVSQGGLAAVVSPVSLAEYGDETIKEQLGDLAWVEQRARAHEHVVEETLAGGTTVPLRLCTIFTGPDRVREMLDEQRERFTEALARVRGCSEWGVKLFAVPGELEQAARRLSPTLRELEQQETDGAEGEAYLARRRLERSVAEEAEQLADTAADDFHDAAAGLAIDAVANPLQRPDVSGHEGQMLLNGAYLVPDDRAEALQALADELAAQAHERGMELELTGPWPPYHFVEGRLEAPG